MLLSNQEPGDTRPIQLGCVWPETVQAADMHPEPGRVYPEAKIHDNALHPAVVQVVNDLHHVHRPVHFRISMS